MPNRDAKPNDGLTPAHKHTTSGGNMRLGAVLTIATAFLLLPIQGRTQGTNTPKDLEPAALAGSWAGTASVPLGDSTVNVPVVYTFTYLNGTITGTAMVPGQGTGRLSNISIDGKRISFRLTVPQALAVQAGAGGQGDRFLDHEGTVGADGAIEGMINYDGKPVARYRIRKTTGAK